MKRKENITFAKYQANDHNIIIHDHRFDIRHWAQNPQLHVGPFHNLIRFLNVVNTSHCLISLPSVFHNTGDKYDRRFVP